MSAHHCRGCRCPKRATPKGTIPLTEEDKARGAASRLWTYLGPLADSDLQEAVDIAIETRSTCEAAGLHVEEMERLLAEEDRVLAEGRESL